ncbi:G8 domain-containing protein [Sungkyunkwania multivorans]|uniref:G8 domain-containing protein n=1 Tax=Sungkyunkwania multivorans TaxID=1173618 RepID=A0ABW3CYD3_9FLAO
MKTTSLVPFIIAFLITCVNIAQISPVQSGDWDEPSTWPNNQLPTANDDVMITNGTTITLRNICTANSVRVMGKLQALKGQEQNAGFHLETKWVMVMGPSGSLEIGTAADPYISSDGGTITLLGTDPSELIPNTGVHSKAIMVMDGGRLELHGKRKESWTNLATTAEKDATQIILKEPVNWEVGDKIAITSTGLATSQTKAWEDVDEVQITNISMDGRTLTLATPLQYRHIGGSKSYTRPTDGKTWEVNIAAEVGILSHSIKIQGQMNTAMEEAGFGGHMMFMKGSVVHAENVELYKMGQKAKLGRYPFHWHLNEDAAQGSYLKNSSIHRSFNRAVTIHGTDYITLDGVFAYDHIGHGIFFEDGGERYNTVKNSVVFVTRRPQQGEELTPSDNEMNQPQNRTPASFWITNPNNYFENNVAAGTEGTGFWFAFPTNGPLSPSGNMPYFENIIPWKEPLGLFQNFVAHSCMTGFDVFDQLNDDHSIRTNAGWDIQTEQYITNGLFYANDQAIYCGLGNGGDSSKVVFLDGAFSDNKTVTMLAANLTIQNSLFNVDTDLGVFEGEREFFRFYDGPGRHIDCHFEGWDRPNSNMIKQIVGGGATPNVNPSFRGSTKGFAAPFPFRFVNIPPNTRPKKLNQFFKDYDGGLLGKANTTLVRDVPFNTDGHEYKHSSWVNAARSDYFFATIWLHKLMDDAAPLVVTRTKPNTPEVCLWDVGDDNQTYKYGVIVNQGFTYNYYLTQPPSGRHIHIIMDRGEEGDLVMTSYKGLGKLANFRVTGNNLTQLNSISAVETATSNSYFIDGNGDVYIKMRANGNSRSTLDLRWDGMGAFTPVTPPCDELTALDDSDGDGLSDTEEVQNCRMPNDAGDLNFEFNRSDESFERFNIIASNTSSETFWLTRADNSSDPYIVRGALNFKGSEVPQLKVRIRSQAVGSFQLFWTTTDQPNFAAARSVTVTPQQPNVFEELVFDMNNNLDWMDKTIRKIRLDFPPDPTANVHTWIDYIHGPDVVLDENCDPSPIVNFISPLSNQLVEGDDLGVVVEAIGNNATAVDNGIANVQLYFDDALVRQENAAPYEWGTTNANNEDLPLMNLTSGTHILKAIATDNSGISSEKIMEINVSATLDIIGTQTAIEKQIILYPNPAKEALYVSLSKELPSAVISIYNTKGMKVYEKSVGNGITTLPLSSLSTGLYFVKISTDTMQFTKKILVRK